MIGLAILGSRPPLCAWTSLALTENEAKYFEAIFSFFTIKYFANML